MYLWSRLAKLIAATTMRRPERTQTTVHAASQINNVVDDYFKKKTNVFCQKNTQRYKKFETAKP